MKEKVSTAESFLGTGAMRRMASLCVFMCVLVYPHPTGRLTEAHSCATNTNATQCDVFVRLRGASWWVLDSWGLNNALLGCW